MPIGLFLDIYENKLVIIFFLPKNLVWTSSFTAGSASETCYFPTTRTYSSPGNFLMFLALPVKPLHTFSEVLVKFAAIINSLCPPMASHIAAIVWCIPREFSNITAVSVSSASFVKNSLLSWSVLGTVPIKRKLPALNPDIAMAAVTAHAPGTDETATPAFKTAATSLAPGSQIVGVPASLTRATEAPSFMLLTKSASLTQERLITGLSISCELISFDEKLLCSATITSTEDSIFNALRLMSSGFPIGTETTHKVPVFNRDPFVFTLCTN